MLYKIIWVSNDLKFEKKSYWSFKKNTKLKKLKKKLICKDFYMKIGF